MTRVGDRDVRVKPSSHVYGYTFRQGPDNEPSTASRPKHVKDRKDPGERLSEAFENYRKVHNAIVGANAARDPKPSYWSGLVALFLKGVSQIPAPVVSKAIADLGQGWLEARRANNEPDQPHVPFLPDQ